MKTKLVSLALALALLGASAACGGGGTETTTQATLPSGAPDVVNVNYFYESDACFCLHLAGEWINTTINTDYQAELDSGQLTYHEWATKDPANAEKMAEFNATNYAFFITVVKDGQESTHAVNKLWLYTDSSGTNELLKSKFIGALKSELDKALAGE
jgi:hypothetical protein